MLLFLAAISSVVASCSNRPGQLDAAAYIQWTEDPANGLSAQKEIEHFELTLLYKPADYIVAKETKGKNIARDSILKRLDELKDYQYYTLRIKSLQDNEFIKTGITSENDYYQRLEYFVSNVQDDISLVDGKDTIPCSVYHFERNYGASPYSNMVLSFKNNATPGSNDKYFIYDDKVLGIGKTIIKIEAGTLKNLPKLTF